MANLSLDHKLTILKKVIIQTHIHTRKAILQTTKFRSTKNEFHKTFSDNFVKAVQNHLSFFYFLKIPIKTHMTLMEKKTTHENSHLVSDKRRCRCVLYRYKYIPI